MPEDVGGSPFADGWEPDDDHDRGGWDEAFASVVFDEDFVQAAEVHEPTAVERLLAAAQARAEARTRRGPDDDFYEDGPGLDELDGPGLYHDVDDLYEEQLDRVGRPGAYPGGMARWRRPVAWALALLMGVGMVVLAFTAVYRGASAGRSDQVPPPATTELEKNLTPQPSASADYSRPAVSAVPRTP